MDFLLVQFEMGIVSYWSSLKVDGAFLFVSLKVDEAFLLVQFKRWMNLSYWSSLKMDLPFLLVQFESGWEFPIGPVGAI